PIKETKSIEEEVDETPETNNNEKILIDKKYFQRNRNWRETNAKLLIIATENNKGKKI
ncbi:13347_t:CDS:1, partial [Racocetra fulgida]